MDHSLSNRFVFSCLKFFLNMGPLVIFFIANSRGQWLIDNVLIFSSFKKTIYPATALFMMTIVLSLSISWYFDRQISLVSLVSGIFVLVFGFLTLWFHDDVFIKIKPTLVNILFSLALFSGFFFKRPFLAYVMMPLALRLDIHGWKKLNLRLAFFFLFLAVLNEIIWRNFSDDFWASFKVFGVMPMTFLFMCIQIPLLLHHSKGTQKDNGVR